MGRPALSLIGRPVAGDVFLGRVEAERRQDRRVHILDRRGLDGVLRSVGIGRADGQAAAYSAARQGEAESGRPVVSAGGHIDLGRAAKLAAAQNHRSFELIPSFQVAQERGERGIQLLDAPLWI